MTNPTNNTVQKVNARNIVLNILKNIFEDNAYVNIALDKYFEHNAISKVDRAFITRIVEGTVENVITIDYIINQFSKVKTNKIKKTILYILRMSIYQLKYMDKVPVSAICNEAVKLSKKRGFTKLSGFVNGVLRNIARNIDNIQYPLENEDKVGYLSVMYSFPKWIIELWLKQFDYNTVKEICINSNKSVGTCIRCNSLMTDAEILRNKLVKEGVNVEKGKLLEYALYISGYDNIRSLNAFEEGLFQVQDESSMLVSEIANPALDSLVIDVCAAPGGKTTHIAEKLNNTGQVISRDIYDKKLKLVKENVDRLKIKNVKIEKYDALDLDESLIEKADVVLLDVPCSGLGIIRKKPDIKYNLTKEDLISLQKVQRDILKIAYNYVKPGGTLVYSTCTVNDAENIENVKWFIKNFPFKLDHISDIIPKLDNEIIEEGCIQLLPGFNGTDGFFIAKLKRMKEDD